MTPTLTPLLDLLFDPDRLSAIVGRPVRPVAARIKPGVQVSLGLADPHSGRPNGWVRVLWPDAHVKGDKVSDWAQRHGLGLVDTMLDADLRLQAGAISTDPALGKALRREAPRAAALVDDPDAVLRYNPLRRVLVRDADTVVRVAAAPDALVQNLLDWLVARGFPAPASVADPGRPHVTTRPFFGDANLFDAPDADGLAWAGRALAGLHALGPRALADPDLRPLAARPTTANADVLARDLAGLDADLGARAARVAAVLAARPALADTASTPALLHGDASADQVLLERATGRRILNDFDRAAIGPAALDLGSWLAVGTCAGAGGGDGRSGEDAFLAGYAEQGGQVPDATTLTTARAHALFARVMGPVRAADPAWRDGVARRLTELEEVLS
ncbi:MAG: phosphotransferase [Propionibacteriaceae bacterium]|nr:phosphotransferase [Propionibacteriaceae bacterium]